MHIFVLSLDISIMGNITIQHTTKPRFRLTRTLILFIKIFCCCYLTSLAHIYMMVVFIYIYMHISILLEMNFFVLFILLLLFYILV